MAITMLRKKPAGEIKELDEKAVDDFLDSASHVKKEAVSKKKKQITLTISESLFVFELRPKDAKACSELKALADAIYNL